MRGTANWATRSISSVRSRFTSSASSSGLSSRPSPAGLRVNGSRQAAALGCQTVALETFSRENVPIYLHFGFQLKQVHTCCAFTEYRLLKPLE